MKPKQIIILNLVISAVFLSTGLKAQETEEKTAEGSQFTFAYPVGTNGKDAINQANKFSFNLLYGVNGGLNGLELGGLANYNHGEVRGAQLAGLANINKEYTNGFMWAGCFNLTLDDARGVQFADLNVATGDFTGLQAGVINYAAGLRGVQFGVINIVGEDKGAVPIGLINVVKGGYYALELTAGEVLYTNVNYKMGVERFYTVFKLGASRYDHEPVYSVGLGFGSLLPIAEKHKVSMDLSFNHLVFEEEWDSDDNNCLAKFDLTYRYGLGEHISLLAGPSFNWYGSEMGTDDAYGNLNIPSHAHYFTCEGYENWMWIGFNAGLAYRF
jgi:hypothetical protein